MTFHYADPADQLAERSMVHGLTAEAWRERDIALIDRAAGFAIAPPVRAIDVGAGRGRLTHRLAQVASHVTAIEPDRPRASTISGLRLPNVSVLPESAERHTCVGCYDLIVCSHVIQHLQPRTQEQVLDALQRFGRRTSVVLVMYASTAAERGALYDTRNDGRGRPATHEISAPERACGLLVCHFASGEIEHALQKRGLAPVESGVYRSFTHKVTDSSGSAHDVRAFDAYTIAVNR